MNAKFDKYSFSGDIVGAQQNLNGSQDLTTPLSGMVCQRGLALDTINLCTNFEVSIPTNYEDMKDNTKYRKCNGLE